MSILDRFKLDGRIALVTGGSRGIGRAIALKLAAHGADIIINYARKTSAAEQTCADIETLGKRAIAIKANLADADKIQTMFDQIESEFGRCDILVGNAASGIPRPVLETTDKHWDWTMDINARSILRCAQHAVPLMEKEGWGRIITISYINC
jgi:enoyl-[acyl-carrier protein] reductase III